jgi:hypothetical protein
VLARSFRDKAEGTVFVAIAIVCFVSSWFWRLHVERGQYYIFSTMLLSLDLAALRGEGRRPKWIGIASGIAVAIKPTNVILLPMLWFWKERLAALVAMFSAAMVVTASFYPSGPQIWSSFLSVVQDVAKSEVDTGFEDKHFGPVQAIAPHVLEGVDFGKAPLPLGADGEKITPSAIPCILSASRVAPYLNQSALLRLNQVVLIALFILGPLAIWLIERSGNRSRDLVLLTMAIALAAVDFARPVRWHYVDVTFLPITAFLITTMPRTRTFVLVAC